MLGPRSIDGGCASLQHQRSTKLLINRFESLSEHGPASRVSVTPPTKSSLRAPKQLVESKKEKSPIRQSLRNLFAVLKKSSGLRVSKHKLEDTKSIQEPTALSGDDPFVISTKTYPVSQLAGSLFYLAWSETSPASSCVLPVWTFCSAVLEGDTVHLTWPKTPSTHSVFLKHCTDVRSRTLDELDPEERALLPGDVSKDLKVFEILFDGRAGKEPGEKFATTSVRERARWVSAIWDVILPTTGPPNQFAGHTASGTTGPDSRPSTLCLDRALPPVPEPYRSPTTIATSTPIPASPIPRRPQSCALSIYSPSKSPSIANLGRLSVVTQRRAQIEGSRYPHSTPASPSRLYRNSSVVRTRSLRVQTLSQDEPSGRESPTSILESYGEMYPPRISLLGGLVLDEPVKQFHSGSQNEFLFHEPPKIPVARAPLSDAHDSLLTDIHEMVSGVARWTEETENNLSTIQDQLRQPARLEFDSTAVTNGLRDINERLRSDLPYIMKLLAQIQSCRSDTETETPSKSTEAPPGCVMEKLNQILELLKEENLQRSVQTHQQADSVRYLNELNSWLEAFVSGGTAQIQVIATGVDKLCQQSDCLRDGQATHQTAMLEASIKNLAALISSESQSFTAQSIARLIEQQRQEQEGLLRALTAELSNEIRGERLRFVDAMKEATTINVHMHVEELKKELAQAVRADLLAYYSKQTQPGAVATDPTGLYVALNNERFAADIATCTIRRVPLNFKNT
ncbi:hypothetical protein DFH08DRAFT_1080588 [Mycena albidolilacea]|uniref:PH domain-containing protein n=1 Tax=Mycena albidolilacea TaxID=1033008 RepID=A0AAD6ZZL5_9AGAR|nr:hypothetical protein DFH08DRAFT_1080588 [Mycena albidolilacea]